MQTALAREKINFLSHFVAMLIWVPLTVILLVLAWGRWDRFVVCLVYGIGAFTLFFCSAAYHKNKQAENEVSWFRKFDHIAIFVMIAGTYTPVVYVWFPDPWRGLIILFQWTVTLAGVLYNCFARQRKRWLETTLYVAMGWVIVGALKPLFSMMPAMVFLDLALGGLFFTVGAVIYAFKRPDPWPGRFGFHEIFHVLIVAGAGFHYSLVLRSLLFSLAS
jgi:hemolysin III